MTPLPQIRRLRPDEAPRFKQVRLQALQDAPEAFGSTYADAIQRSDASWQQQTENSAAGDQRATFIACLGDQTVGLAALYRQPEDQTIGEMLQVWVAPASRSDGTAVALIMALLDWGRAQGMQTVWAAVKTDNQRALRFYERLGFSLLSADHRPGEDLLSKALIIV